MPPTNNDFDNKSNINQRELMGRTVNEIVSQLIKAHKDGKDVNLNKLKCEGNNFNVIKFNCFFLYIK